MHYEFESLEEIVHQLVMNQAEGKLTGIEPMLKVETKRLARVMTQHLMELTSETQISIHLQVKLSKLVGLANHLYNADVENHANTQLLLNLIEEIRKPFAAYIPGTIQLPYLFVQQEIIKFNLQWESIKRSLDKMNTDALLIEIIAYPFKQFNSATIAIQWIDFKYLKNYANVLERSIQEDANDEWFLIDVLIGLNFNYTRFSTYHAGLLRGRMDKKTDIERTEILKQAKLRVAQADTLTNFGFEDHKIAVADKICKWIDLELKSLQDKIQKPPVSNMKLKTKLKALELAFWEKLQYDLGLYEEVNLDIFSEKIAYNFMTVSQDDLSALSIKSKFYTKDPVVLEQIEKILDRMLQEIRKFTH